MKVKPNKVLFKDDLITIDELYLMFKNELYKTTKYSGKCYQTTSQAKLERLRLTINDCLKGITKNVKANGNCSVDEVEE